MDKASSRYSNMFGRSASWIETIKPHELERKLLYTAKAQLKTYRVLRQPGEDINTSTGEITPNTWQTKDRMCAGNHVRMAKVMTGRRLEDLVFGNGEERNSPAPSEDEGSAPIVRAICKGLKIDDRVGCSQAFAQGLKLASGCHWSISSGKTGDQGAPPLKSAPQPCVNAPSRGTWPEPLSR